MTYKENLTAKEKLEKGEWIHVLTKSKGLVCAHYYAEKISVDTYCVNFMFGASSIGVPLFFLLKVMCKLLSIVFNFISKGLGDKTFKVIIEEADELLKGRKHKLSTGYAFNLSNYPETLEDCKRYAENDFNKRIKKSK